MSPFRILLRCLLIATFFLEGSMSLWASTAMAGGAMAAGDATHVVAAEQEQAAIDQDCEDAASQVQGEGGSTHYCDCSSGSGCCACVFPVLAITHSVPFSAQHLLATQPAVPSRAPVVLAATTLVFRPPIG